jgi:hypothetical protein
VAAIDSYLDRTCARLRGNPAEVEDVRRELRAHLEDLIEEYCAEGMSWPEAAARAIDSLGEPERLHHGLALVHSGDTAWLRRLKGIAVGAVLGAALSLLLPFAGHGTMPDFLIGVSSGACIGLLSTRRSGLVMGPAVGALCWFAARVGSLAALGVTSPSDFPSTAARSVLVSLLVGAVFGGAVATGSTALLSLLSRSRRTLG